jgi:hypothetical protein
MALTRRNIEVLLIRRLGALLTEADLDGSTLDGANHDLADPIGWAVRQCGGTVANFVSVADDDVATVAAADYDKLLDLAEYRTLQSVSGNLAVVDIQIGPRKESLSQLGEQVEQRLARKLKQIQMDYDFGLGALEAGVIGLDIAAKLTDGWENV